MCFAGRPKTRHIEQIEDNIKHWKLETGKEKQQIEKNRGVS